MGEGMFTETKILGETLHHSSPTIYMSSGDCGDLGCFSLSGSKPLSNELDKTAFEYVELIAPQRMYSEYYVLTFHGTEQSPQHAVCCFSHNIINISEVKAVTFQIENDVIRVWTFISKRDKAVRKAIYMKELDLMDDYPNMVFDFNVVSIRSFSEPFIPQNLHGSLSFYRNINGE